MSKKFKDNPGAAFDRTNVNMGIYQVRRMINHFLRKKNPIIQGAVYEVVALWVSGPGEVEPPEDAGTGVKLSYIPTMKIKIYFRHPLIHANLPPPPSAKKSAGLDTAPSKIKHEDKENLRIFCHPYIYVEYELASNIQAGDTITIRFLDGSIDHAEFVTPEDAQDLEVVKIPNSPGSPVPASRPPVVTKRVPFLFDGSGDTSILGTDNKISPQAVKLAQKYYEIMKERSPCKFLSDWKARFQKSFAEAEEVAQTQSKKIPRLNPRHSSCL